MFQTIQTSLTVLALTGNCVSLLVIYGLVRRLTSPLRQLTSLSFADMLAAWAMMTLYLSAGNSAHHVTCGDVLHTSLLLTSHNAAALSLTSLATSHHIATFRPLQYELLLAPRRVWVATTLLWALSGLLGHVQFIAGAVSQGAGPVSYCEAVSRHTHLSIIIATVIASFCLLAAVVIYASILIYLRPVDAFVQPAVTGSGVPDGRNRSTRGVVTGILLFSCYALAWLPYLTVRQIASVGHVAVSVASTTLLVGCVANPVVYGSRMSSLQDGYGRLWGRGLDCARRAWSRCRPRPSDDESRLPTTPLNQLSSICY